LFQKAYNSWSEPLHFVSSLIVGLNCKEYFFSEIVFFLTLCWPPWPLT
jgi:hypothetical protein